MSIPNICESDAQKCTPPDPICRCFLALHMTSFERRRCCNRPYALQHVVGVVQIICEQIDKHWAYGPAARLLTPRRCGVQVKLGWGTAMCERWIRVWRLQQLWHVCEYEVQHDNKIDYGTDTNRTGSFAKCQQILGGIFKRALVALVRKKQARPKVEQ